jgi:hypothetical protein
VSGTNVCMYLTDLFDCSFKRSWDKQNLGKQMNYENNDRIITVGPWNNRLVLLALKIVYLNQYQPAGLVV